MILYPNPNPFDSRDAVVDWPEATNTIGSIVSM